MTKATVLALALLALAAGPAFAGGGGCGADRTSLQSADSDGVSPKPSKPVTTQDNRG